MSRIVTMSVQGCCDGQPFRETMSYPFKLHDGGRSQSRRPKQHNDCTVRALAIVTGLAYDIVYDRLAKMGRKCGQGFYIWKVVETDQNWCRCKKLSFPAAKGERRMNPHTFCRAYPTGRYIVRTAKHVAAVIDGVLYDTSEERPDRCIYTAWQFTD